MKTRAFRATTVIALMSMNCFAQSMADSLAAHASWGESVHGVQMSIAATTNAISAGSTIPVNAQIRNTSTNTVTVRETASRRDFSVWLENASGQRFALTDNGKSIIEDRNFIKKIHPGEIGEWELRLTVGKEMKSGDYTMKATRKIKLNGKEFVVGSNPLKTWIK